MGGLSGQEQQKRKVRVANSDAQTKNGQNHQKGYMTPTLVMHIVAITSALWFVVTQRSSTRSSHHDPGPDSTCDLPRLDMLKEGFTFEKHFRGRRAVILEGLVDGWPALRWNLGDWSHALRNKSLPLRDMHTLTYSGGVGTPPTSVLLDSFLDSQSASLNSMVFSHDRRSADIVSFLLARGDIDIPPALAGFSADLVLSIGGRDTGVGYHDHDEAWLALLSGTKQWFMRPPEHAPAAQYRRVAARELESETGFIKCTQRVGEVIYIPGGWWHATYNLERDSGDITMGIGGQGASAWLSQLVKRVGWPWLIEWLVEPSKPGTIHEVEQKTIGMSSREMLQLATFAAFAGNIDVLKWMARDNSKAHGVSPIFAAAFSGRVDVLSWLSQSGGVSLLDASDDRGNRPVQVAASMGHVEAVDYLLDLRADVSIARNDGQQLVHAAASKGHIPLLARLVERRGRVDASNGYGVRPIHEAVVGGHSGAFSWLMDHGASIDSAELRSESKQALQYTLSRGHADIMAHLHEHYAALKASATQQYLADCAGYSPFPICLNVLSNGLSSSIGEF